MMNYKDVIVDRIENENDFASIYEDIGIDDIKEEKNYEKENNYNYIPIIIQCFKNKNYNFPSISYSSSFIQKLEYEMDKENIEIDLSKLDKKFIKILFDVLLPYITNVKELEYFFLNELSIPFISQKFHLILKATLKSKNYDILEHILLLTAGNILPIVSFYKNKPLINDINIIKLLDKYGYFKNKNILFQQMANYGGKTKNIQFVDIILECDTNIIDYILSNIFPLYHLGLHISHIFSSSISIETVSILIKHGLLDLYRYYIANTNSYKLALILYHIDNIKAYKDEVNIFINIYNTLLFLIKNKYLIKIISLYLNPNDDINNINKQIETERELLFNGTLFGIEYQ